MSSNNKSVLSANFGLEPPEAIASMFVRYSISHTDVLPTVSTSDKQYMFVFKSIIYEGKPVCQNVYTRVPNWFPSWITQKYLYLFNKHCTLYFTTNAPQTQYPLQKVTYKSRWLNWYKNVYNLYKEGMSNKTEKGQAGWMTEINI